MHYDFDVICDRKNTSCAKWDAVKPLFGRADIIPMWVADMDFPAAAPIIEALEERAKHPFYGYTQPSSGLIRAVVERMERKFGWRIKPDWIVFTPGVIPALGVAVRALTHPGDEVLVQEPVYYPFFRVITGAGCQVVNNALKLEAGQYRMDFGDLLRRFGPGEGLMSPRHRIKAMILCNPQNPVGRLWSADDLTCLGQTVIENGATVISDEIHCELLYPGHSHTPFASLSPQFEQNSIICMAPSKTFNLAGLEASSIIIPNEKLRARFTEQMSGLVPGVNLFGLAATEAAYRHGDEWLEQLLAYLAANLEFTLDFFTRRIPRIGVIRPQATYLLWLDCRELGLNDANLRDFIRNKARLGLDDGYLFGAAGSGFQRMNIACPRALLTEALERLEAAVNSLD